MKLCLLLVFFLSLIHHRGRQGVTSVGFFKENYVISTQNSLSWFCSWNTCLYCLGEMLSNNIFVSVCVLNIKNDDKLNKWTTVTTFRVSHTTSTFVRYCLHSLCYYFLTNNHRIPGILCKHHNYGFLLHTIHLRLWKNTLRNLIYSLSSL